jgi:hypothetical protein
MASEILDKLRADCKALEEQIELACKPYKSDLQILKSAIEFYERKKNEKTGFENFISSVTTALATPRLVGLSHSDAVIVLAKSNGGIIRTQDAKRLMIKAGIMSQTKNSTNMAHNAINRTGRFERISPGEYRLKTEAHEQGVLGGPHGVLTNTPGRLTN